MSITIISVHGLKEKASDDSFTFKLLYFNEFKYILKLLYMDLIVSGSESYPTQILSTFTITDLKVGFMTFEYVYVSGI